MTTIHTCPICSSSIFKEYLKCKDFTVSHKIFTIVECESCFFKFTNPRPETPELGKYYKSESYVSHTSSKKGLINFLYNYVRKITLKRKLQLVKRISKGKNILDLGAGTGHFAKTINDAGFNVTAVEPDPDARKLALELNQVQAVSRESMDTLAPATFDLITLWHVLEHLPDLNEDIDLLKKLLGPDGTLLIAVPNCSSLDAGIYKEFWAGYDVPRHLYHFTPETISRLLLNHGFERTEMLPMNFDAYYVSMLSEKNKSGGILKGFLNGWKSNRNARKNPGKCSSQIYLFQRSQEQAE